MSTSKKIYQVLLSVTLLINAGTATGQVLTDLFMSPDQEKRIGAQEHERILEQFGGAYSDKQLAKYVSSLGQLLSRTSKASSTKFTFTVLNSPVVNAFALPGGYVYVTRGLLALADSEAELAAVLAHEIGHVAARHGAKRHSQSVLANLGLMVLGVATESSAAVGLGQLGAQALISGYSRQDEYEADNLGIRYLRRAKFDPNAMASFLRKLERHHDLETKIHGGGAGGGFSFFDTHPRTADRVSLAKEMASEVSVKNPIVARDIYYQKIDGMIFGDDPAQGLIKGRRFIHPQLGFQFDVPKGFTLLNGQSSVIAQSKEGAGIKFDLHRRKSRGDLRVYIQREWAPKTRLTKVESFRVNGMPAATALVKGVQNGKADARLVAIAFDQHAVYRFVFIMPIRQAKILDAKFRQTTLSFKRLSKAQASQVRPRLLKIHKVTSRDSVKSLASLQAFPDNQVQRFTVLNGLYADTQLKRGDQVKIVVE